MTVSELKKEYTTVFPFWNTLSADDRELLCRYTVRKKYSKGDYIHGGDGEYIGAIVKSGCVRAYMLSEEGREITLRALT